MSIDDATPAEWNRSTQKFTKVTKEYVDPYDQPKVDPVNSPQHYNYGNIECIDYLQDNLKEGFEFYCDGNVKKYLHRWRYKGKELEDLRKAHWYLKRLIAAVEAR